MPLLDTLKRLAPADARSLLLELMRDHAGRRSPAGVLAQYEADGTVAPERADARVLHVLDGHALAAADAFEAIELAPVGPLGTNAALGGIDQNNVLSTVRNTEVIADPTAAMALESASRRRRGASLVRLCSLQRVIRLQSFGRTPGFTAHFRLFGLVSAGRGADFEAAEIAEHVRVYQRLLAAVDVACEVQLSDTRIVPVDGPRVKASEDGPSQLVDAPPDGAPRVLHALAAALPEARFDLLRRQGLGYYDGPTLRISAIDREGIAYAIADGGMVDWTQRLLSDRKERLLISGIGLGLLALRFV